MSAEIVVGLDAAEPAPSVVAAGFFDGVHRGHRAIIDRARSLAGDQGLRAVVATFDRHPLEVIAPDRQPRLLQTHERRAEALAETGVDLVVVLPFDDHLRRLAPEDFVAHVLRGPLDARGVVVGENFRFGHRAAGDVATLRSLAAATGLRAEAVELLVDARGEVISSTAIRGALEAGDVERAAELLGRPHVVDGRVVRGDGRGRDLGFPTANLATDPRLALPAPGVYAGVLRHPDGRALPAATSVGTNPTFDGQQLRVEAYLLDLDEDLYGLDVALELRARVRGEERFASAEALVDRMRVDVAEVRELLGA